MENTTKAETYRTQELLVRLDRNNEVIQKLSIKLSSYTYEPRCASHFEKYHALKGSFKAFADHQKALGSKIKRKGGKLSPETEADLLRQLDRYRQLESAIADYLLDLGETP